MLSSTIHISGEQRGPVPKLRSPSLRGIRPNTYLQLCRGMADDRPWVLEKTPVRPFLIALRKIKVGLSLVNITKCIIF